MNVIDPKEYINLKYERSVFPVAYFIVKMSKSLKACMASTHTLDQL